MKPLIGVTTSEMRRGELATLRRHGEPAHPEMALGLTYLAAIDRAGGMPVVLPPLAPSEVSSLLDRLDGICLSGGPDIDPETYGERERHPELGETEAELDAFELAVAREADARGLPLLGICRGAQTLNVARGGTLHQDVPGHRQSALASVPTHEVAIALHSRTGRIMGASQIEVNSFHHQAVDRLGDGLCVAARADDGTVEEVECRAHPFLVGVQWHAETLVGHPAHCALFRGLVRAASGAVGFRAPSFPRAA